MTALPPISAIALIALAASIISESCASSSSTPSAAPRLLGEITTMVPALVLSNSSSTPGVERGVPLISLRRDWKLKSTVGVGMTCRLFAAF